MITKRKDPGETAVALEKQRFVMSMLLIALITACGCVFLYVSVNLYLMIKTGSAPQADLGKDVFSQMLSTLKLVIGVSQ